MGLIISAIKGAYKQIKYAYHDHQGKVEYDSDIQKRAAGVVGQGATVLHDQIDAMDKAMTDLDDAWRGKGATEFKDNFMTPTKDDLSRFTDLINTYQDLIKKIADLYDELTNEAEQLKLQ
jgi:WXG100 family type VII secretion target